MKACGLIVEYNPFHNGHLYHLKKARETSRATCMIAIMSGPFLQRGEPAIIDKFHRTKAALHAGVDLVIELPYSYAVQSSALFAKGAIHTLNQLGVSSVCFGSESGNIDHFTTGITTLHHNKLLFNRSIRTFLDKGFSYPKASSKAYENIGINEIDLFQPNNILGFSYVKTIMENNLPIQPITIRRINNDYHDATITSEIASATSIRKEVMTNNISNKVLDALSQFSTDQLTSYKECTNIWHNWENYFSLLHYKVMTMNTEALAQIHGMEEGIEHRIKRTAMYATSFQDWLDKIKTKRYTQTRLQRLFVHLLTHTTKDMMKQIINKQEIPYIRLLGMNETGQAYLHAQKKEIKTPIFTNLNKKNQSLLAMEEYATNAYYSILPPEKRIALRRQEFRLPIIR